MSNAILRLDLLSREDRDAIKRDLVLSEEETVNAR